MTIARLLKSKGSVSQGIKRACGDKILLGNASDSLSVGWF